MKSLFVTGIGTSVGKTITACVLAEALRADYWKPVQCGDLGNSDTDIIRKLISNTKTVFHKETFAFKTPASPHLAASLEGVDICLNDFELPKSKNIIIIEGAGGLMVPLNNKGDMMIDLIKHLGSDVIIVSQNYLGSINHTLLTYNALKIANVKIAGIVFNGDENIETESFILKYTGLPNIGNVRTEETFTKELILNYAASFNINLIKHN